MSNERGQPERTTPLGGAAGDAARDLLARRLSLVIASADASGDPLASYAPFVAHDHALHVFVSRLASHFSNLALERNVSVMAIEDESRCPQPFARMRLTLRCRTRCVPRESASRAAVLDALESRLGATVATLRSLPDFELFRLEPQSGLFVQGFGRAHSVSAAQARALIGPGS